MVRTEGVHTFRVEGYAKKATTPMKLASPNAESDVTKGTPLFSRWRTTPPSNSKPTPPRRGRKRKDDGDLEPLADSSVLTEDDVTPDNSMVEQTPKTKQPKTRVSGTPAKSADTSVTTPAKTPLSAKWSADAKSNTQTQPLLQSMQNPVPFITQPLPPPPATVMPPQYPSQHVMLNPSLRNRLRSCFEEISTLQELHEFHALFNGLVQEKQSMLTTAYMNSSPEFKNMVVQQALIYEKHNSSHGCVGPPDVPPSAIQKPGVYSTQVKGVWQPERRSPGDAK
ncbi:hypothetical protein BON22_4526 [Cyberlindnera fabianii]|uniref:Uncharacterized protein n=1 Tax=Cyberlindnera fabianii TaxID=36022 RepID=A0A1V2L0Z1_CYBFA|nr:hypothetical protein BON22_4526 [Cyberlindnera fabianii]